MLNKPVAAAAAAVALLSAAVAPARAEPVRTSSSSTGPSPMVPDGSVSPTFLLKTAIRSAWCRSR